MAATALQLIFAALAGLIVGRSLAEQPAALEILPELASGDTELHPDPAGEEDEEEEAMTEELINSLSPGVPSYFEGDIILTEDQRAAIEQLQGESFDPHEPQQAITRSESRRWPGGRVPYTISSSLGSRARSAIEAAVREYAENTCIQLYPRGSEKDYIHFYEGGGCSSSVGRVGGSQRISIGRGCEYKGIVVHEIFHALGRWHEQSRPDRDQFVDINYENMKDGVRANFIKLTSNQVRTQGVNYDYGSIMHYSAYAFSRNGRPTIESKNPRISSEVMGQRVRLSSKDIEHVSALYCSAEPASWGSWGAWSPCSRSCNGGARYRTRSCEGGSTCSGSSSQQQTCNSQPCAEQVAEWSTWGSWSGCSVSCGVGRQSRSRQCLHGNSCSGATFQYRDCNREPCPLAQGVWSDWSSWSPCSTSCGGGEQSRSRNCLSEPCEGPSSQQRSCNTEQCPSVAGVSHEGCYQVLSGQGLYLLEGRAGDLTDNPFRRTEPVRKCAMAASQLSHPVMSVAAGFCCVSGRKRLSDFTRVSATQCRDGRGAYENEVFYMDVYTITGTIADEAQTNEPESQEPAPTSSGAIIRTFTQTLLFTVVFLAIVLIL